MLHLDEVLFDSVAVGLRNRAVVCAFGPDGACAEEADDDVPGMRALTSGESI